MEGGERCNDSLKIAGQKGKFKQIMLAVTHQQMR
jgi:hypothetical protein